MKIIKIGAVWCPGCLVMKKIWKKVEENYPELDITEYDLDFDNEEVKKYNVGHILPIIIFLKNGIEQERVVGEISYDELISYIKKY